MAEVMQAGFSCDRPFVHSDNESAHDRASPSPNEESSSSGLCLTNQLSFHLKLFELVASPFPLQDPCEWKREWKIFQREDRRWKRRSERERVQELEEEAAAASIDGDLGAEIDSLCFPPNHLGRSIEKEDDEGVRVSVPDKMVGILCGFIGKEDYHAFHPLVLRILGGASPSLISTCLPFWEYVKKAIRVEEGKYEWQQVRDPLLLTLRSLCFKNPKTQTCLWNSIVDSLSASVLHSPLVWALLSSLFFPEEPHSPTIGNSNSGSNSGSGVSSSSFCGSASSFCASASSFPSPFSFSTSSFPDGGTFKAKLTQTTPLPLPTKKFIFPPGVKASPKDAQVLMGVFARSISAGPYGSRSTLVVQEELILTPAQSLLLDICNWCLSPPSSPSSSSFQVNSNRSFSVLPSPSLISSSATPPSASCDSPQKQEDPEIDEGETKHFLSLLISSFPSFSEITKEEVQQKAFSHYIRSRKMKNFMISETVGLMEREPSLALSHLLCWLLKTREDVRFLREGKVLQKWVKKVGYALQTQRSLFLFINFS